MLFGVFFQSDVNALYLVPSELIMNECVVESARDIADILHMTGGTESLLT